MRMCFHGRRGKPSLTLSRLFKKGEPPAKGSPPARFLPYSAEKSSLPTPQSGQVKSSGMSSHLVPGAMPFSGSPFSSSYSQPQTEQTYFMIFTSETEFLPNFILCRLREVMPRKRINYIISTFGILSIVFGKIFRKNFRNALSV